MADEDSGAAQRERLVGGFWGYASRQSELGREFARHIGLHVTDSAAIVAILRAEDRGRPLTPARLAERIGLTSGATSILLNRLEGAGHVTRTRGHADRRLVTLHSSAAVHATADAFFGPLRAEFDALMRRYSPDELALVERFVTELRATVDAYAGPDETATATDEAPGVAPLRRP